MADQIAFKLIAKVKDQEVSPKTIGFALFNQFNREVEDFLAGSQRRGAVEEVKVEIQEGSYKLLLLLPALLYASVEPDLRKLQHETALAEIDPKRAEVVKQWQKRARTTPGYRVDIQPESTRLRAIRISSETEYRTLDEDDWVAVEKYIVGTVVDMGGTTAANVHVVNEDTGRRITAESSEDFLRGQKENYLYQKVQMHIAATENVKTGELKDIRLISFVGRGASYDEAELETAIEKGTQAWSKIEDPAQWLKDIRGSGDE
jgi:hypothetical protein